MERFYKGLLGIISEKIFFSHIVFHIEQNMKYEKFNYFVVGFLRYNFGRMKVVSAVAEREHTPNITRQICLVYQLTGFYMIIGFTEWYYL